MYVYIYRFINIYKHLYLCLFVKGRESKKGRKGWGGIADKKKK